MSNVYERLQKARIELQKTELKKSGNNKFAGYSYFELSDFLPTVQTILTNHGLFGHVSFDAELAVLSIRAWDKPDEIVQFCSPMRDAALKGCHAIQNLGAVQTYLRRYLWVTAMEIVEHDALDAVAGKDDSKKAEPTVESPRIVGLKGEWQINAPADPLGGNLAEWLSLIKDSTFMFLDMCNKPEDVLMIFRKNKVLFDTVKITDPEFFKVMMERFTEVKTKLEKEKQDGTSI